MNTNTLNTTHLASTTPNLTQTPFTQTVGTPLIVAHHTHQTVGATLVVSHLTPLLNQPLEKLFLLVNFLNKVVTLLNKAVSFLNKAISPLNKAIIF